MRKLVRALFGQGYAHVGQQLDHTPPPRGRIEVGVIAQRLGNLIADGVDRVQGGHRVLEDHRNLFAANAAYFGPVTIQLVDANIAPVRMIGDRPAFNSRQAWQ